MPGSERGDDGHEHPPWLPIPSRAIAVVEHPCVVKNPDKGIDSLGGPVKLSKGLRSQKVIPMAYEEDEDPIQLISVSLRPDDPFAKRLLSTAVTTNNLLLKVTVPKRTGRKRKRGSSGPFLPAEHSDTASQSRPAHVDASTIYRSLQDNSSAYKVALAGVLDETHRFRAIPDLQYSATHNDSMIQLREHILPTRFDQLKKYNLNTDPGAMNTKSVGPSAEFWQMPIAYNYQFQQNTYVKYTDQGVVNLQKRVAYNSYTIIRPTDRTVPAGPKSSLPSEQSLTPYLQSLVTQIRKELDKRPIITRHLLYNILGWDKRTRLRQAAVYCGYFFESGPWREALIKWGVDPRKDPKYRQYQTISFLSYLKTGKARHHKTFDEHVQRLSQMPKEELEHEHIFDGKTVSTTGNLFQFCDITDPLIAKILATNDIRSTCAPTFQGWYHVGTWAKATVILKDKMNTILGGETPDDAIYARIASWPEIWDDKEMAATYKAEVDNRQIHQEKKKEHEVMHNVRWAARNPRYTFKNMEQGEGQRNQVERTGEEGMGDVEVPEDTTEIPDTADVILNEGEVGASPSRYTQDEDEDDASTGEDEDAEGEDEDEDEDEDYDDEMPLVLNRADGSGPAPFGGLFSV